VTLEFRLRAFFEEIVRESRNNKAFAERLRRALGRVAPTSSRGGRRAPGRLDPFDSYAKGPAVLSGELEKLEIDELKDIISEHGMDSRELALKWKSKPRLIELILAAVALRSQHGDAFRRSRGDWQERPPADPVERDPPEAQR
jgi:hypothetical protein